MNTIQTLEECKDLISKVYLIDDLASRNRETKYVFARHTYCGLLRNLTKLSSARIGESINRDHATILHSCKVHYQLMQTDKQYRERYRYCTKILIGINGLQIEDPCDYIRKNMNECTDKQLEEVVKLMKGFVESNNNKHQYDRV